MKAHTFLTTLAVVIAVAHLAASPEDEGAKLTQEGWKLWQSGNPAGAIPKFKEATKLTPKDANVWNGLGWATFNSGDAKEAERAFNEVIKLEPNHAAGLNGLGQIYLSRRDYAKAEPMLVKAAQKAPAAWFGLTRMYLMQGKFAEAEKWAQMLVDSGQADAVANKMLEAAKAKSLSDGLRMTIEPPAPSVK